MKFDVNAVTDKRHSGCAAMMAVLAMFLLPVLVSAQTTFPRINFQLPSGNSQDVCIEPDSIIDISNQTGDVILLADAAAEDLSCPGEDPVINSLSATPSVLDISTENCDPTGTGTDDTVCLFLNWDITPAITPTTCTVEQIEPVSKFSMVPFEFDNPSSFVDPQNPNTFVSVVNGLQWPVNLSSATTGLKRFRMQCASGSGVPQTAIIESTFQDGATPAVTIDTFNVVETEADLGSTINFNWNVTLVNSPLSPSCTLSSPSTISSVTVPVTAAAGSSTATILNTSPTGNRNFTFSCRASAGGPVTDQQTDSVLITDPGPGDCPAPIVPTRDNTQTTYAAAHGNDTWPGTAGQPFNISVSTGSYKALQFVATSGLTGNYATVEAPVSNSGSVLLSISECPGDFTQTESACVDGPSLKSRVIWADPALSTNFCDLVPGRTYFLNMYFGDLNGINNCSTGSCVTRGRNQFN